MVTKKRNNIVTSGNYGDTAKDTQKNSNSPLGYRLILLSRRISILEKEIIQVSEAGITTIGGVPPASGNDYTDAQIAVLPSVAGKQDISQQGLPNGYPNLDVAGKVPLSQIPPSLIGGVSYQGSWNATTNTPPLSDPGTKGYYYVVSVAGTHDFGSGPITFAVGDWAISNGVTWERVDGSTSTFLDLADTFSSYAGRANQAVVVNPGATGLTSASIPIVLNQSKIIYVSKVGNDASDGLTLDKAKLTIAAGIAAAAPGDVVYIQDAGVYNESIVIGPNIKVYAPNATITGTGVDTITLDTLSEAVFAFITATGSNNCVKRVDSSDIAVCTAKFIVVEQGKAVYSASEPSDGVLIVNFEQINVGTTGVSGGIGVGDNSGVNQGNIFIEGNTINCIGDNTIAIANNNNGNSTIVGGYLMAIFGTGANTTGVFTSNGGIINLRANYMVVITGIDMNGNSDRTVLNISFIQTTTMYTLAGDAIMSLSTEFASGSRVIAGTAIDNYQNVIGDYKYPKNIDDTDSPYTVQIYDERIYADASGGPIVINLPPVASNRGLEINIKKIDADVALGGNTVTIDGNLAETIDGQLTVVLNIQYDSYTLHCDGTQWFVI